MLDTYVFFVDETIVAGVDELESLSRREGILFLCQNSQLLCLNFVLKMCCPGLKEKLSSFRVKDLGSWKL